MTILNFHERILQIIKNSKVLRHNNENREHRRIPYENQENHEQLRIQMENYENHENDKN